MRQVMVAVLLAASLVASPAAAAANIPAVFDGASADGLLVWFSTTEAIPGTPDTDTARDVYERAADQSLRLISTGGANLDADFHRALGAGGSVWFSTTEAIPGTGDTDTARDIYERTVGGALRLTTTGGTNDDARFLNLAADGRRLWFSTVEAIPGTGDFDQASDVYEWAAGSGISLVSRGGVAGEPATYTAASADGSRVWFRTVEAMPGTGDTDQALDVYERSGGTVRLISTGGANVDASIVRASADGTRVWFRTLEPLPGTGDADTALDVYERDAAGALRLISAGTANTSAAFTGASANGQIVWFATTEAIPGTGDTDSALDLYERRAGAVRLITPGTLNVPAGFAAAAADGSRVWFETVEPIPGTGDSDLVMDVYEMAGGAVRLASAGVAGLPAEFRATDGRTVWFRTHEPIAGTGDTDTADDVYELRAGTTGLVSAGAANLDAKYLARSANGRTVWFRTDEAIPGTGDTDLSTDVYERSAGSPARLISTGQSPAAGGAYFLGASADASRVRFMTTEAIPGTGDTDTAMDVYERRPDGTHRLIST
ncbi:hypothetical protein [Nonomuraea sp. LPB2021202275-12-8]|uniref:hypothetical protein n=1 Tax=Nonomuraea sp. LPB2021202275-12-8 TaxID=3120159 RepID=UPI00300D912E